MTCLKSARLTFDTLFLYRYLFIEDSKICICNTKRPLFAFFLLLKLFCSAKIHIFVAIFIWNARAHITRAKTRKDCPESNSGQP